MELDELKEKWAEQDRKLDLCIRLNMLRVESPLRRFAFLVGLGALMGLVVLVILGQFIYQHWAEPRFALPALLMHVWVIATVAASIRQIAMARRVDYDEPVALIQKQLESLRVLRIRITQRALLTGQFVWWVPFLIVALKGVWGVDAYKAFGAPFLMANLAFGLAVIPLAIWVSRKLGDRMGGSPTIQWLIGELAGHHLNAAGSFLAAVSEFENE